MFLQSLSCVDLIFSITRSLKSLKKAKKLVFNKFNITETQYTLWSDNLFLNISMHSRHKSQEATFVDFLLQGKYHAKDFCF